MTEISAESFAARTRTVTRFSPAFASSQAYLALRITFTRICSTLCLSTWIGGYVLEVAAEHHPMTAEGPLIHPQAVLDQHANVERIDYATASGVVLLHPADFLDVPNFAAQRRQFRGGCITLADEIRGKLLQIGRQVLTLSTRQER